MAINFEKYANEGHHFVNELARQVGHPQETGRTGILLRAVLHTLRDRITISESFDLMAQLPMFLKSIYVDNWKYHEKPLKIKTEEDFIQEVERHQARYGEQQFLWEKSTRELIQIVLESLGEYISPGEFDDIIAQLPLELKDLVKQSIKH